VGGVCYGKRTMQTMAPPMSARARPPKKPTNVMGALYTAISVPIIMSRHPNTTFLASLTLRFRFTFHLLSIILMISPMQLEEWMMYLGKDL